MDISTVINQKIQALGPQYKLFVESDFTSDVAGSFGTAEGFTARQIEILENALVLYLLMVFSQSDAVSFISRHCSLSQENALTLWLGIESILPKSVLEFNIMSWNESKEPSTSAQNFQLQDEIMKTEHDLESLHGIRTMAHDMKEAKVHPVTPQVTVEPTHQSSQADLLREIETLAAPSTVPRWDTEK